MKNVHALATFKEINYNKVKRSYYRELYNIREMNVESKQKIYRKLKNFNFVCNASFKRFFYINCYNNNE